MPTAFEREGARPTKQTRYAPLWTNRWMTGLWTQRSPLRDAATNYITEKYFGSRFDSLIGGLNTEISPRLTVIRRPGTSVYNSQTFGKIDTFYSFRQFANASGQVLGVQLSNSGSGYTVGDVLTLSGGGGNATLKVVATSGGGLIGNAATQNWSVEITNGGSGYSAANNVSVSGGTGTGALFNIFAVSSSSAESIRVLADDIGAGVIYDATGPSSKVSVFEKSVGSTQSYFQSVGNTVFIGDGIDLKKFDGSFLSNWGITGPASAPVLVTDSTHVDGYPDWVANNAYTAPYVIVDSNFNLQKLTQEGTSQTPGPPTWGTDLGDVTTDGTAQWTNVGNINLVTTDNPALAATYVYAYKNSFNDDVSTASPASNPATYHLDNQITASPISLSGTGSTDPQVDTIAIYRTAAGGSTYDHLVDIPNTPGGTWFYTDTTPDVALDELDTAPINGVNNPPPAGLINLTYHLGRIFGSVNNVVYYSNGPDQVTAGNGDTSFSSGNFFAYPSRVVRLWPMALGLLVFTTSDVYIILGQGTSSSPLYDLPFAQKIGMTNYNAFDVIGGVAYFLTSDLQLISFDPSNGISEVGFPIGDEIQANVVAANAYVTWHNGGSTDKALYLAQTGTTLGGWIRMNPTAAPETGLNWSPTALVNQTGTGSTSGCSAVQSVEVSPGVRYLLIGPTTGGGGGPILRRDLTVNKDAVHQDSTGGFTYDANAVVGSVVLANPGQMAEVGFISTNCPVAGTSPALTVWFDEDSTKSPFPAGASLSNSVNDPPQLAASTTFLSKRYYLSQTQEPAWCHNMQIKFDWGSVASPDELYTYSIWGSLWSES